MKLPAILLLALLLLSGCSSREQDVETIIASELLASYGIVVNAPQEPFYTIERVDRDNLILPVTFYVRGEYGIYYFSQGGWNDALVAQFVNISEDSIKFAKNWLGYTNGNPLTFIFNITEPDENHPFPIWSGGGVLGTAVYISMPVRLMPSLIVHEAVHAILRHQGRETNFPHPPETSSWHFAQFLEEGLCDLIDFLFFMETDHDYDTRRYRRHRNDIENHLHHEALRQMRFFNNFEDEAEWGTRYAQLMSYETAASFILFLLEYKGTPEDFMKVFDDIYRMEEVFGKNMENMIPLWLDYLDGFH